MGEALARYSWKNAAMLRVAQCLMVLLLPLLLALTIARADDGVDFVLKIEAPRPLEKLLKENLALAKAMHDTPLPRARFDRLYEQLSKQTKQLLATEGYYTSTVNIARTPLTATEAGVWRIALAVTPGKRTRVADIAIEYRGDVANNAGERAAIGGRWTLPVGSVFRQADWENAKRDFLRQLLTRRYPHARVLHSEARIDPATARAYLKLQVDSGPAVFFGELTIAGLQRYPTYVVRDLSPIVPGTPYDQSQLLTLQTRLQNSGYFKTVEVRTEDAPSDVARAPVTVQVSERERRQVGFGVGFSTDVGPRGKIEYRDLNLRTRGWRLNTGVEVDRVQQTISAGIDLPEKPNGARDSVATSYTHKDVSGEITDTARAGVNRANHVGDWERVLSLQYQTEVERVIGAPRDNRQALVANSSWTRRHTDDLLYPTRGYLLNAQVGGAHRAVLSDRSFVRLYAKGARYYAVQSRATLMFRSELGYVVAGERTGIPIEYLFKTGGDQSVRGYGYQTIGAPDAGGIAAGRYLAVASSEYTYWFRPQWGAATFYDIGTASDTRAQLDWFSGYGIGARWRSPVGPVSLDVAYGKAVHKYRLHFSLGFVF